MKKGQKLNLKKMERKVSPSKSPVKLNPEKLLVPVPPKKEKVAKNSGAQADPEIDECSIKSEHEMTSDLFDFHKLMEMENFGVKRYNKFCYKG